MARVTYVELPVGDVAVTKAFYETAFGWTMSPYGPSYAATSGMQTNVGLQGDPAEAAKAPLAVIKVEDLAAAEQAVIAAGGRIVQEAFDFPGGRRFQFVDPAGNELAVVAD